MTNLIIVRHGHTEQTIGEWFRGINDSPLSERGRREAELAGKSIAARWKVKAVYTSEVPRARETAAAIARPFGLKTIDDPGLLDMDYGRWTGLSFPEAKEDNPELYDICFNHPSEFRAPGGQSFEELRERSVAAVKAIAERHEGQDVVIVSHTVIIRLLILGFMDMPTDFFWRIRQGTCAINLLQHDNGQYYFGTINDTCHTEALKCPCHAAELVKAS